VRHQETLVVSLVFAINLLWYIPELVYCTDYQWDGQTEQIVIDKIKHLNESTFNAVVRSSSDSGARNNIPSNEEAHN
jgi:hypothetical protein